MRESLIRGYGCGLIIWVLGSVFALTTLIISGHPIPHSMIVTVIATTLIVSIVVVTLGVREALRHSDLDDDWRFRS